MWTKVLRLLTIIQLCFQAEAIFKRVVKGWIHEEFPLRESITKEDDLLQWFKQHKVFSDLRHLDLSEATLMELSRLPLVFYKEYAHREHFKQIWPILRDEENLSTYLQRIKEMSAFVEPGAIPNTIINPDGSIPWRRQTGFCGDDDDPASSQNNSESDMSSGSTTGHDLSSPNQDSIFEIEFVS